MRAILVAVCLATSAALAQRSPFPTTNKPVYDLESTPIYNPFERIKLRSIPMVTDYGVRCDGVTNDAAAIQSAINAAAAETGPQKLLVPAGNCLIGTTALTAPRGLTMEGTAGTFITYTGSGTALTVGSLGGLTTSYFVMKSINIDISTAAPGANGIRLNQVVGGKIEDATIFGLTGCGDNCSGYGILAWGGSYFTGSFAFNDVTVNGAFGKGVWLDGPAFNVANAFRLNGLRMYGEKIATDRQPKTGRIGLHYGFSAGDGWILDSDCDSYDICYQIDGQHLKGNIRAERNSVAVHYGPTAANNTLTVSGFNNFQDQIVAWTPNTTYTVSSGAAPGQHGSEGSYYVYNGSPARIYRTASACTSGDGAGPTCTSGICRVEGTCTWTYYGMVNPPGWAPNSQYQPMSGLSPGSTVHSTDGFHVYRLNQSRPCTSARAGPGPVGADPKNPDGTCTWSWIGATLGISNTLLHPIDFVLNISPPGPAAGTASMTNQNGGPLYFTLQSGGTGVGVSETQGRLQFNNSTGTTVWRLTKAAGSLTPPLIIDDGTNTKLTFNPGATGAVQVGATLQLSAPVPFARLPASPADGMIVLCSNCTIANPCAAGGRGTLAKRISGIWVCN
jgi:hypothetical protein